MARPFDIILVRVIIFAAHLSWLLGWVFAEAYGDEEFQSATLWSGG